jgi:predicted TIM-barrel fold metal-dependent hydrolase
MERARFRPALPSSSAAGREPRASRRRWHRESQSPDAGHALDQVKALEAAAPGRFTWFNSYDVTQPDGEQVLTQAVKSGAQGFGEMKFHVAADGSELRRMYALAADLHVPILIHFQEVDHFPNEGTWSTGFAKTFESPCVR